MILPRLNLNHTHNLSLQHHIIIGAFHTFKLSLLLFFRSSGVTVHDTCNRDHIASAVSSSHYCQPVKKIVRLELPSNVSFTQVMARCPDNIVNTLTSDDAESRVRVQVWGRVSSLGSQLRGHGADSQADPRHPLQVLHVTITDQS